MSCLEDLTATYGPIIFSVVADPIGVKTLRMSSIHVRTENTTSNGPYVIQDLDISRVLQ